MNTKAVLFILTLGLSFVFTACDKIDSITQKDFNLEVTTTQLIVDQPVSSFAAADTVDLSTNKTFLDNKTRIKSLRISEVLMTLNTVDGNAATTINSISANVSRVDGSEDTNLGLLSGVTIAALNGVETSLPLSDAGKNKLSALLLDSPNQAILSFIGSTDAGPVKFTVVFRIKMVMTAGL